MTACAEFNLVQRKVSPSRRVGLLVDGYEHHDYVVRPKDKTPPAAAGLDEHLVRDRRLQCVFSGSSLESSRPNAAQPIPYRENDSLGSFWLACDPSIKCSRHVRRQIDLDAPDRSAHEFRRSAIVLSHGDS